MQQGPQSPICVSVRRSLRSAPDTTPVSNLDKTIIAAFLAPGCGAPRVLSRTKQLPGGPVSTTTPSDCRVNWPCVWWPLMQVFQPLLRQVGAINDLCSLKQIPSFAAQRRTDISRLGRSFGARFLVTESLANPLRSRTIGTPFLVTLVVRTNNPWDLARTSGQPPQSRSTAAGNQPCTSFVSALWVGLLRDRRRATDSTRTICHRWTHPLKSRARTVRWAMRWVFRGFRSGTGLWLRRRRLGWTSHKAASVHLCEAFSHQLRSKRRRRGHL